MSKKVKIRLREVAPPFTQALFIIVCVGLPVLFWTAERYPAWQSFLLALVACFVANGAVELAKRFVEVEW